MVICVLLRVTTLACAIYVAALLGLGHFRNMTILAQPGGQFGYMTSSVNMRLIST